MSQEFLPLCDVLFNIISLVSYFCDVVFDVLVVYTLFAQGDLVWFAITLTLVLLSLLTTQFMSLKWYFRSPGREESGKNGRLNCCAVISAHVLQCGVLLRYFKLFIPVDLRYVKRALRDLCLLRLTHAFCEAAPMLLIQLHFIWRTSSVSELTQLNVVSTSLSLVSVCWALASFNKHIRLHNLHKLVLTWLGVIFQFMWRLGTVSSRVAALSLYATMYHFWVFLVIALHWISMFLWLMSPKNVFHGERVSRTKKCVFSLLISYVYIFCYVNLLEVNSRKKMMAYYVTMFLENSLLMIVWLVQQKLESPWFTYVCVTLVWGGFAFGIVLMMLYYRYFHVKHLKHGQIANDGSHSSNFPENGLVRGSTFIPNGGTATYPPSSDMSLMHKGSVPQNWKSRKMFENENNSSSNYVPGVFNCRLNPAFKRKKKKPTTFIPVPVTHLPCPVKSRCSAFKREEVPKNAVNSLPAGGTTTVTSKSVATTTDIVPFWKRPLPKYDRGSSSSSLIDIRLKLQEKKQQQLQELRVIEEEIKQGKLQRPNPLNDIDEHGTFRQPIPQAKKQPYVVANRPLSCYQLKELILAPRYLDQIYFDHQDEKWRFAPTSNHHSHGGGNTGVPDTSSVTNADHNDVYCKSRCIPSDLDSQVSLPRSFTLPREFRYQRKAKIRKNVRSEHIVSTNSSDGDVDSGDENDQQNGTVEHVSPQPPQPTGLIFGARNCCNVPNSSNLRHHETQL